MILEFSLTTDRQAIRASAPQAEFEAEVRNIAGYSTRNQNIVSIGDTPEDMQRNAPEYWDRNRSHIVFVHPFRFDEAHPTTGKYEPLFAARIVAWLAAKAFAKMKRQGLKRMLLSPWVDRVDYNLQLEGFDKLPPEARRQFVRHLKKLLVAARRVQINGEIVSGR